MTFDWIVPLVTLSAMEIVLGIDNVIFIAIVVGQLPPEQQGRARRLGLVLALGMRVALLFALKWILGLDQPIFRLTDLGWPEAWLPTEDPHTGTRMNEVSWRDLILLAGGLFLIAKSTYEIHDKLEGSEEKATVALARGFGLVLVQIAVLDIVFSLDSVITAVGMARQIEVMVAAMVVAMLVMLFFAGKISDFVHRHPTLKILALAFLILIGVMLLLEGVEKHIERGYIYFAMAFSLVVELLNLRLRVPATPVTLREPAPPAE
jgi:predicted tellurium resistance membrane protein TerC